MIARAHHRAEQRTVQKRQSYGALLWVSVLLHSLLVLLPWSEKSPPPASSQAEIVPIVAVSQIPGLVAEDVPPSPSVSLPPPVQTATVSAPPTNSTPPVAPEPITEPTFEPIFEQARDRAVNEPIPNEPFQLNSTATGETSQPGNSEDNRTTRSPEEAPKPSQQEAADEAARVEVAWENFVGHVQRQSDGFSEMTLLEIFDIFGEPGQVNQFFDENSQPKLDVYAHHLFPEQAPEQILETVVMPEVNNSTDFDLQRQETFTAGLAYQLLQGEMLRYLIIVPLNERSGSVLLFSDSLPEL
ncbi:MAG: hypothetical protein AAFP07_14985 [Cyanobacteria bacterium J06606_4]